MMAMAFKQFFMIISLLFSFLSLNLQAQNNYVVEVLNDLRYPGGAAIVVVPQGCQPEIGFIDYLEKQIFDCQQEPQKSDNEFLFNVGTPSKSCFYSCKFGEEKIQNFKLSDKNICQSNCI